MTQEEKQALEEKGKKILDEEEKEGDSPEAPEEGETEVDEKSTEQDGTGDSDPNEDIKGEIDKLKKANNDILEQLKEERKKRRLAEVGNPESQPEEKEEESGEEDDVTKKVLSVIGKEKQEQAKQNRQKALMDFWDKHPEFHPDNDITGMRMDVLDSTLKERFNTSKSISYDDIKKDYEDAYFYLNKDKKPTKEKTDTSTIASESQVPTREKVDSKSGLTPSERKMAQELGMDEKRFLEMKKKHPQIVS